MPPDIHSQLWELITACWHHNPNERPSFKDILNFLYKVADPKTCEKYMETLLKLSEAVLPKVVDYLELSDIYNVGQVCKGWYVIVEKYVGSLGLQAHPLADQKQWTSRLLQRHTMPPRKKNQEENSVESSKPTGEANPPKQEPAQIIKIKTGCVVEAIYKAIGLSKGSCPIEKTRNRQKELQELKVMIELQRKVREELLEFKKQVSEERATVLDYSSSSSLDLSEDVEDVEPKESSK